MHRVHRKASDEEVGVFFVLFFLTAESSHFCLLCTQIAAQILLRGGGSFSVAERNLLSVGGYRLIVQLMREKKPPQNPLSNRKQSTYTGTHPFFLFF